MNDDGKMLKSGMGGPDFILASASPRRRELLSQIGLSYSVCPSAGEEIAKGRSPGETALLLSYQKAEDVFERLTKQNRAGGGPAERPLAVIGADTIVCMEGRLLGKPKNEEDAFEMLSILQDGTHQVFTGVTVLYDDRQEPDRNTVGKIRFYECTEVTFYPVSEEEIKAYVMSGDAMDKAGAYGIQGRAAAFVKGIRGDYNNVVGLPVGRLYQELKAAGLLKIRKNLKT